MYNVVLKTYKGAREVALRLRALTALPEDPLQLPAYSLLWLQFQGTEALFWTLHATALVYKYHMTHK